MYGTIMVVLFDNGEHWIVCDKEHFLNIRWNKYDSGKIYECYSYEEAREYLEKAIGINSLFAKGFSLPSCMNREC